jgi:hypothetical protein
LDQAHPDLDTRGEALRRQITEADRQRFCAQLEALGGFTGGALPRQRLTVPQIKTLINGLGGPQTALRAADPADRAEIYEQLGLHLTYDRAFHTVLAQARPTSHMCAESVSEGRSTPYPYGGSA